MSGILRLSASASGPTRSVPYCTAPRSGSRRRRCRRGGGRRTGRPHPRSHRRRRAKGSQISRCGESSSTPLTGAPWWVFWTSGLEKFSGAPWIGRRQDLPGRLRSPRHRQEAVPAARNAARVCTRRRRFSRRTDTPNSSAADPLLPFGAPSTAGRIAAAGPPSSRREVATVGTGTSRKGFLMA